MSTQQVVCFFCSADNNVSDSLKACTEQIGSYLASKNLRVLTGGSEAGLMKCVADGYLKNGDPKQFQMVIPQVFRHKENTQHLGLSAENVLWVESFHEQLRHFESVASVFIVMPGGYGTLLEFFHLLNQKKVSGSEAKIILFNFNGFWDCLLKQFDFMVDENTLKQEHRDLFYVARLPSDLNNIIFDLEK